MPMKPQSLAGIVLSAKEGAKLIGKSRQWLEKLVSAGFVRRDEKGFYRPADIAQGQIAFMADEQRRASKTITLAAVQAARAKEIELRIAREDHRIVDLDEAIAVLDEIIGGLKADFDGLGASITRDAALRSVIDGKVQGILCHAADGLAQRARTLRASGSALAPDAEDDAGPMGGEEPTLSIQRGRAGSA
jgi:hypothetical protein